MKANRLKVLMVVTVASALVMVASQTASGGLLFGHKRDTFRKNFNRYSNKQAILIADYSVNYNIVVSQGRGVIKKNARQMGIFARETRRDDDGGGILGNLIGLLLPIGGDDPDDNGGGLPIPIGP